MEGKDGRFVHQLWIGKKLDASDVEHMLWMFYTIHQKTGPNRNVAIKKMHIDGDKHYPFLYHDFPVADLSFMKCIVDKLPSVTKAYSSLIHIDNYGNYKLCELLQIEFNKEDFETLNKSTNQEEAKC